MCERLEAYDMTCKFPPELNHILDKFDQCSGRNDAGDSVSLFSELLHIIEKNHLTPAIKSQLYIIFQKWNFTDDSKEMDIVVKLLVQLKDTDISRCYLRKMVKLIEKYDLSKLILTKCEVLSKFLSEILNTTGLDNPDYVYYYAMHLQIQVNDSQFARLDVLQNYIQQFVDIDGLFHHGIKDDYSSVNIHHNNSAVVERQLFTISKYLGKQLFATAAIFISEQQDKRYLDSRYISYLVTIVSSDVSYLSWGAISVLYRLGVTQNRFDLLEMIFPTLISMVVEPFENSKILEKYTKTHHIPLDLIPISMLADCVNKNPALVKHLHDIKMVQKIEEWYSKFNLNKGYISRFDLVCFSKYLLIMSNMVSLDDKTKRMIAKSKMNELIMLVLRKHVEILQLWTTRHGETLYRKAFLLSVEIVLAACTLLRGLSRSPSFLRTFFIKNSYMKLLSNILFINSEQLRSASMGDYFLRRETELETVVLGTLSNLIIEFLPSCEDFNVYEILKVVDRYLNEDPIKLERCLAALSLIRNGLFANDLRFFQDLEETIGINRIFGLCDYQDVDIQIQSFNIIRNILATKTKTSNSNYVYEMFQQYTDDTTMDFVEFVRMHLNESHNLVLTTTLCYVLVHFSSLNIESKVKMIKNTQLMKNLLDILHMKQKTGDIQESFWEVKTCIAWIIINLTTADTDDENHPSDTIRNSEDYKLIQTTERSNLLIKMGFHETFKMLPHDCPSVDFIERASRAVFQLLVSCNDS